MKNKLLKNCMGVFVAMVLGVFLSDCVTPTVSACKVEDMYNKLQKSSPIKTAFDIHYLKACSIAGGSSDNGLFVHLFNEVLSCSCKLHSDVKSGLLIFLLSYRTNDELKDDLEFAREHSLFDVVRFIALDRDLWTKLRDPADIHDHISVGFNRISQHFAQSKNYIA